MQIMQAQSSSSSLQSFVVNLRRADGVCVSESLLDLSGVEPSLAPLDASPTRHSETSSADDFQQAVSDTEDAKETEGAMESDEKDIDVPPEGISEIVTESEETPTASEIVTEPEESVCEEKAEDGEGEVDELAQGVEELKVESPEIKELTEGELLETQPEVSHQDSVIETPSEASGTNEQEQNESIGETEIGLQHELPAVQLKVGSKVEATMLYVSSPDEFWVHVTSERSADLEAMSAELQAACEGGSAEAVDVTVDCVVAAFCEGDSLWYRARVTAQNGDTITVHYVDYGNSEEVPLASIKPLPEQHWKLPAQATKCACADVRPVSGDEWDGDAADLFNEITLEKKLLVDIQRPK